MITILLGSRKGKNSRLDYLLNSLSRSAFSRKNYEVLVKLDDDDPHLEDQQRIILEKSEEMSVRSLVSPRAMGYEDLHKAYMDLYRGSSVESKAVWVLSDDVLILGSSWDRYILHAIDRMGELFVLCPTTLVGSQTDLQALEIMDNYPIWSTKFLNIAGFGYTFSTDSWTNTLLGGMREKGVDIRKHIPQIGLNRVTCPEDGEAGERWTGARKRMFEMSLSPKMRQIFKDKIETLLRVYGH